MAYDKVLFVENCKHSGPDALIVQRNEGIRWVTCTKCGADFVRSEFYVDLREGIVEHDRRNTVDGGGRARCYPVMGELLEEGDTDG
jgi:hypothetical protein